MAGLIFITGGCLDLVFSATFKQQIRSFLLRGVVHPSAATIVGTFAKYLVQDVIQPAKMGRFLAKALALSILFYIASAYLEVVLHGKSISPTEVQISFLQTIALLHPAVWVVVTVQLIFDIFSFYLAVLFLRLLEPLHRLREIVIVLISNLLVTAFFWSAAFSVALSLHVKVADLDSRFAKVALYFEVDPIKSRWQGSFVSENASLKDSQRLIGRTAIADEETAQQFFDSEPLNRFYILTNEQDQSAIAATLFRASWSLLPNAFVGESEDGQDGKFFVRSVLVRNVMDVGDFLRELDGNMRAVSSTSYLLGPGGYTFNATRQMFRNVYYGYISDNFIDGYALIWCDGEASYKTLSETAVFDFGKCKRYLVAPRRFAKYLAFISGSQFVPNYLISPRAFFWSSMALTFVFYMMLGATAVGFSIRSVLGGLIAKQVFESETRLFTSMFGVVSALFVLIYIIGELGGLLGVK